MLTTTTIKIQNISITTKISLVHLTRDLTSRYLGYSCFKGSNKYSSYEHLCTSLCKNIFSFLLNCKCLLVIKLNVCLILSETVRFFCKVVLPLHLPVCSI